MNRLQENQRCTGIVEGYTSEGQGVVRLDGAVVFVPGAVRGERVEFAIRKVTKTAAVGELVRVLDPSPRRRAPDCPWFGQCGGCDFRHLTYEEELWAKRQRVEDALRRIGGAEVTVEEILGADCPLGYRNKSQYPVGADGAMGFYRARSHQVVPVAGGGGTAFTGAGVTVSAGANVTAADGQTVSTGEHAAPDCLIQPESANRTAEAVRRWMERYQVPPYDERTGRGLVRHIYVRCSRAGESLCCVVANGRALPREPELAGMVREAVPDTVGVVLNVNTKPGNVVLGQKYRTIWGRDYLLDTLRGLTFRLSVPSFYQVNPEQAEVLYGKALEFAGLDGPSDFAPKTALDLYCGIGTITLCLAERIPRVVGAEIVERAVRDARENAARNGLGNVEFLCADASETAVRLAREGFLPELVTVDPPRKGLAPEAIEAIAAMGPERVVYVSCDPGTLGRDVKRFAGRGYRAVRAAAVDMFPGTRHVESVVLLSRHPETEHGLP